MVRRVKKEEQVKSSDDRKTYAFIATFLSIIGFIIALVTKKKDKYVMFYAKQSLVVFIASIILWIIGSILAAIFWNPYSILTGGLAVIKLINTIVGLATLALWLFSWIYALSGEMKEVPIVGKYAEKIKL